MKSPAIIAAAAMALVSISLSTTQAASGPTAPPDQMQSTIKNADIALHNGATFATDATIYSATANACEYALTRNDMARLVTLFPQAQQQSIEKSSTYSEGYGTKLNAKIDSISKAWTHKYGHEFSAYGAGNAFNQTFASIRTETPAQKDSKVESAVMTVNGASKLSVPLVCEQAGDWRINVPSSLTAKNLRGNLLAQLSEVDNQAAHWPANEADAYQLVADHVLAALLEKPMPAHAQASVAPQQAAAKVAAQQPPKAAAAPVSFSSTGHWYQFWKW